MKFRHVEFWLLEMQEQQSQLNAILSADFRTVYNRLEQEDNVLEESRKCF